MESSLHLNADATLTLVAAATTIVVLFVTLFRLRPSRIFSMQRPPLPPGPSALPLLGNLPFLEPDLHSFFARLAATYGPIFRLRLGMKLAIIISSPPLCREVLHDQDLAFANHDVPAAAGLSPTVELTSCGAHMETLGACSAASVFGNCLAPPASPPFPTSDAARSVQPSDAFTDVRLSGIQSTSGTRCLLSERLFRELVGEITLLLGKPNLSDFFPGLERFDLQGIARKMGVLRERLDEIYDKIIESKRKRPGMKGEKPGEDFLDYMLKLEEEGHETNSSFTITHVKAMLMDIVVGGTDTTSNTVEFALAEMLNRPETIKRAQDELEYVVGRQSIVEEHHLSKLPYLNAIIKEVLRLHPAVPLLVPHRPSSTCTIGGYTVPEGSRVFINAWAIQRDPTVWKEPLEFRPERFMDTTVHERKWDGNGNDFSYLPFGSGRRICAGIAMAEKMLAYSLASLLHSFDWKLQEGKKLDLSEKFGIVLKKAEPLIVIPVARLSNPDLYC